VLVDRVLDIEEEKHKESTLSPQCPLSGGAKRLRRCGAVLILIGAMSHKF